MEFAARLPRRLKIRQGQSKYLLKQTMRGVLPDEILDRPKMGFGVPVDRWFREDCRDFVHDTLLSARALQRGYFKPTRLRQLVEGQESGACSYGSRVYALLMLELWHRECAEAAHA
jgi:asparagine synthase (glutamine-hydrolysing)